MYGRHRAKERDQQKLRKWLLSPTITGGDGQVLGGGTVGLVGGVEGRTVAVAITMEEVIMEEVVDLMVEVTVEVEDLMEEVTVEVEDMEVEVVEVTVEVEVVEVTVEVVTAKCDYPRRPHDTCTMPLSISDGALEWQRLAVINKHPRDDRIQFEEETHTYTIDGVKTGWTSCTGFLHNFFGHFDADAVIAKMMKSPKWFESKYFGLTAEQIKKQWSDKGAASSSAGTRMHLDIEHFYNAMPALAVKDSYTMEDGFAGLDIDKWIPQAGPEWDYFCEYQRSYVLPKGFVPFRTEWLVFDPEHKVAGSIDMIYKKPDGTLAIYDWKRIEELKTENKFQSGLGPVSHLPDTNYWHYSLQLNVYRYMIQKHYGYVVSELALVVLHPGNTGWKVAKLNFMDDEVVGMMAARAAALAVPGNDGSKPLVVFQGD